MTLIKNLKSTKYNCNIQKPLKTTDKNYEEQKGSGPPMWIIGYSL